MWKLLPRTITNPKLATLGWNFPIFFLLSLFTISHFGFLPAWTSRLLSHFGNYARRGAKLGKFRNQKSLHLPKVYRITTTSFTFMNLLCLPSFLSIPIRLELSHTFCFSFLPSSQALPRKKILIPPARSAFQSNSHNPPKLERSRPAPTTFRVSFYGINYLLAGTASSSATPLYHRNGFGFGYVTSWGKNWRWRHPPPSCGLGLFAFLSTHTSHPKLRPRIISPPRTARSQDNKKAWSFTSARLQVMLLALHRDPLPRSPSHTHVHPRSRAAIYSANLALIIPKVAPQNWTRRKNGTSWPADDHQHTRRPHSERFDEWLTRRGHVDFWVGLGKSDDRGHTGDDEAAIDSRESNKRSIGGQTRRLACKFVGGACAEEWRWERVSFGGKIKGI